MTEKEERSAADPEFAGFLQAMTTVLAAIQEQTGGRRGATGQLSCPACPQGTVYYSVSAYNGHRSARCTTAGCLCFME